MGDDELDVIPEDFDPVTSIDNLSRKSLGFLGWIKRIALYLAPVAMGFLLGWAAAKFS